LNLRPFVLWNGIEWVPNVIIRPRWSWPRRQWALRRARFAAAYMNWKKVQP
jgi:hypothetical protein